MTTWNPNRDPNKYPAAWHSVLQGPPGRRLLVMTTDTSELRRTQNKFNAFKASLRNHPLHQTAQALAKRRVRLTVETLGAEHSLWAVTSWSDNLVSLIEAQLGPLP